MENEKEALKEEKVVVEVKESEYIERIKRIQAEFENFRKRTEKERMEISINANKNIITELLNVLDHFELSLKHNKDKGITMIYDELFEILKEYGLKAIEIKEKFDPKIHEAVIKVDGDKEGVIIEELQKGYLLNDRLLRASKVKVSRIKE